MATAHPRIMFFGVPVDHPTVPEEVRPMVGKMLAELGDKMQAAGAEEHIFAYATPEGGLAEFAGQLRDWHPDAIVIGSVLRTHKDLQPFFEQVIDTIRENAPMTKILFNTTPLDSIDAVRRWFPLKAK